MLVLTRKLGQDVLIGDHIRVKVLKIDNNKVQLGISAPKEISIFRQEVIDKIKAVNRLAAKSDYRYLQQVAQIFRKLFIFN